MKKTKSKGYQHKIVEISFDQVKLNNFSEDKGIGTILSENSYSEELLDLRSELLEEVYDIINGSYLTEHQRKIRKYAMELEKMLQLVKCEIARMKL